MKREEHVYVSNTFEEVIRDTLRFFNATPIVSLPPDLRFHGTGVYAIYYTGANELYQPLSKSNQTKLTTPIYVGKAVPRGWRQARQQTSTEKQTYELNGRLREHDRSIQQVANLELAGFYCRFVILEKSAIDLIGTVEAALIRYYKPLWNTIIDGFGNHDPGKGRYNQAKSDWDVIHQGRTWADKCKGESTDEITIKIKIAEYFNQ